MSLPDCFELYPAWIEKAEATDLLALLTEQLPWEVQTITMFGRQVPVPRMTAWFGDEAYVYSGVVNVPSPMPQPLRLLNQQLESQCQAEFNSCLANLYRTGDEYVGWHADNEPTLGARPTIASISLGASRDFLIRHEKTGAKYGVKLSHGDLLVMRAESQSEYKHSLPKRKTVAEPRLNLTFRHFRSGGTKC
ncbi:alpha-ketoglutarate-dependent dioxygenase AlkB family protein [Kribbella sp. NPDC051587]|uniref:alpha-ketoglutarate-dependent dioxygenase AlkB family protein n=1 Tax=Kribbella sp. NPDC051587 TaxID=3364119 RepID=UPI00378AAC28